MAQERIMITSPVVRIVQGDIYNPSTKDMKGNPLVYRTGVDAGKPRVDYFLKTAFAKTPGQSHWSQGDFGKQIWNAGASLWNGSTNLFWKIEDGDDATPNIERKGRKNCDNEGWPGNWVMKFGSSFAPKLVHMVGGAPVPLTEEGYIKCGDYVQVYFEVRSNNDVSKPGLLYNAAIICFTSGGKEIYVGPDASAAGFGQAPMPANAEVRNFETTMTPTSVVSVVPNMAFGSVPTAPPPVPAAPAPIAKQMTPAANGVTYEAYIAAGWNDAQMVAAGLLMP
jgi:hypothetical protein